MKPTNLITTTLSTGTVFGETTWKLKGKQIAELGKLLQKFQDQNYKEYGEEAV